MEITQYQVCADRYNRIARCNAGLIAEAEFLQSYETSLAILTAETDTRRPAV